MFQFQISFITRYYLIFLVLDSFWFYFINIKKLNATFIGIFPADLNLNSYQPNFLNIYERVELQSIYYILQYPKWNFLSYYSGLILELKDYKITHEISFDFGSSDSPIWNQRN
jgi:hypothetical protein